MDEKALVLYKMNPAVITGNEAGGKLSVKFANGTQKVRETDIIFMHPGPVNSIEKLSAMTIDEKLEQQVKDCWELLVSDEESASAAMDFQDLISLCNGKLSGEECWGIYLVLKNTYYFSQVMKDLGVRKLTFIPRSQEEIDSLVQKERDKAAETALREAFLQRLKIKKLLPEDSRFMLDVEALALGKSEKSRTLHEAHMKETPENAHKLLLDTGIWKITQNPYPLRWGLNLKGSDDELEIPPEEERLVLDHIAWAIDNEHSTDPDDAVAFDGKYLWIHIADPTAVVTPDSSWDKNARNRGTTLYLPEGCVHMLSKKSPENYALGYSEKSRALSFRLLLDERANILECQVMKSLVAVKRTTYAKAEEMKDSPELKPLFDIARVNCQKRHDAGSIQLNFPEVDVWIEDVEGEKKVHVEPFKRYESSEMIREMMLLAGEGAARFAFKNNIPFPYISQDAPEIPGSVPDGPAGQVAMRRCFKKRMVGVTPSAHSGLGLGMYSQVTSPLRRYGDLLAHMQLRSFLSGKKQMDKNTLLQVLTEGDLASQSANQAIRKSLLHWKLVYLLQNPDWTGEAVCVDKSGKLPMWSISSLAIEIPFIPKIPFELNDTVKVKVGSISLPDLNLDIELY